MSKISKVLDILIEAVCNVMKRNELRITALPFLFQAMGTFNFSFTLVRVPPPFEKLLYRALRKAAKIEKL